MATTVTPGSGRRSSKMYWPNSKWTWTFMGIILAQCIIALALEGYVFGRFQAELKPSASEGGDDGRPLSAALTIPTYLSLFIFGFIYQLVLGWDALRLKNTIQVIGICLYNFGMLVYAAVEMTQVDDAIHNLESPPAENGEPAPAPAIKPGTWADLRPYLIAAPVVIALCTVLLMFVAWKLYDEFAWTIYKHISADLRLKRRYLTYQIYIALLKFDFFFFLGFVVQFVVIVPDTSNAEFYITIAALPIIIILLFLAAFFTRRESYLGQSFVIVIYFAAAAYYIFKLVRMYDVQDSPQRVQDYGPARKMLTTFAILTLILLVVTIATAFACMKNFNKGLRPHVQKRAVPNVEAMGKNYNYGPDQFEIGGGGAMGSSHQLGSVGGPPSHRMTID